MHNNTWADLPVVPVVPISSDPTNPVKNPRYREHGSVKDDIDNMPLINSCLFTINQRGWIQ
jgi:hypothetical protein